MIDAGVANLVAVLAYPLSYQMNAQFIPISRAVIGAGSELGGFETTGVAAPVTPAPAPTPSPAPSPAPTPSPSPSPAPASSPSVAFSGVANGTSLAAISSGWGGGYDRYEVQNGALQALAGRGSYGEYAYYTPVTSADQSIELVRKGGSFSGSLNLNLLQTDGTSQYFASFSQSSIDLRRQSVAINYNIPTTINWANDTTLKLSKIGGVIKIFINGAEIYSYTDPTPISTGGSPGFSLSPGSDVTLQRLVSVNAQ